MSQWQPIETAPRDGTFVLLGFLDYPKIMHVRDWVGEPHNCWRGGCQPTHWMPLPAPPSSEQPNSAEITLFKKPNDPNERVNKPNYNPPSFEDFDK